MKGIPGSHRLVATATPHHGITSGSLYILDPRKGEDGLAPITRLTPEVPFPESEGWKQPGTYAAPMPVNDTLFFASYCDDPGWYPHGHPQWAGGMAAWPEPRSSAIWLVDTLGGRELIYKDPAYGTYNPIPIVKRKKPPVLASSLPPNAGDTGVCYVEDCYDSRHNIPNDSIAALRVNLLHGQPAARRRTTNKNSDIELYKEPLGTVPVNPDGSAAFRIPAGVPLQLQAIDTNGMAVLTMRSFIYSQKGEVQGCTGCHEDKRSSRSEARHLDEMKVHDIAPEVDLGYARPDLDRGVRQGVSEVVYGAGKSAEQIAGIVRALADAGQGRILVTRVDAEKCERLRSLLATDAAGKDEALLGRMAYDADARLVTFGGAPEPDGNAYVVVCAAGTSDLYCAQEAALTAEMLGSRVERLFDVGVAGIHRLLAHADAIQRASAVVAVAGMEGALASVVGGLAPCPVIACPTSVGYGASFGGVSALLSMLNSCASGVSVVNIDNGFGAGYQAALIDHAGRGLAGGGR